MGETYKKRARARMGKLLKEKYIKHENKKCELFLTDLTSLFDKYYCIVKLNDIVVNLFKDKLVSLENYIVEY